MRRRKLLRNAGVATAAAVAISGCSMLGGCGPGEDSVEEIEADLQSPTPTPEGGQTATPDQVSLKGSIQSYSQEEVVIDDTTGTAKLIAIGGFMAQNIEGGECAYATGYPTLPEDESSVDVTVFITDVGLAE